MTNIVIILHVRLMVPCSISQADEWQQALACLSEVWKIASGFYLDPEHGKNFTGNDLPSRINARVFVNLVEGN